MEKAKNKNRVTGTSNKGVKKSVTMAETPHRANDEDDDSDGFDESILKGLEVVDMWYDDDDDSEKQETEEQQTTSREIEKHRKHEGKDDRRYRLREHSKESEKEKERERERERERRLREREFSSLKSKRFKEREELIRKRRLEDAERELLKLREINERRAKMGRPLIKLPVTVQRRTLDELNARRAKEGLPLLSFPCEETPLKGRSSREDYADDHKFKASKQPEENRIIKLEHLGEDLPSSRAKKLQVTKYNKSSELSRSVMGSAAMDANAGYQRPRKPMTDPYIRRKEPEEKTGNSENVCVTQVLRHTPGTSYSASVITYKTNISQGSVSQYSTVVETSVGEPPVAPPPPPRLGPISFKISRSSKSAKGSSATAASEEENDDDDDEIDEDDDDFKPSHLSQHLLAATKSQKKAGTSVYKRMDDRKKVYTSDASLDSISPSSSPERDLQLSPVSSETERAPSPIPRATKVRRKHILPAYASEALAKGEHRRSSPSLHISRQRRRAAVSRSPSPPVKRKRDIAHSPVERVSSGGSGYKSAKERHCTVSLSPEPQSGLYGSPSRRSKSPTDHGSRRRQRSPFWKEIQRTLAEEQAMKRKQMQELVAQHSPVTLPQQQQPPPQPQQQAMYTGGQPPYQSVPPPVAPVQTHIPHPGVPNFAPAHHPPGVGPGMPLPGGPHPGQPVGYPLPPPHRQMPPPNTYYGHPGAQWSTQSWVPPGSYPVASPQPVLLPPKPVAAPIIAAPQVVATAPPAIIESGPVKYSVSKPVPPGSKPVNFVPPAVVPPVPAAVPPAVPQIVPPAPAKSKAQTKRERQLAEFQFARPAIKPTKQDSDKGEKQMNQDFQEFLRSTCG